MSECLVTGFHNAAGEVALCVPDQAVPLGFAIPINMARGIMDQLIANGGVHSVHRAQQVLDNGADLIALGKAALANPDFPRLLANGQPANDFDPTLLGPIANIKARELEA